MVFESVARMICDVGKHRVTYEAWIPRLGIGQLDMYRAIEPCITWYANQLLIRCSGICLTSRQPTMF